MAPSCHFRYMVPAELPFSLHDGIDEQDSLIFAIEATQLLRPRTNGGFYAASQFTN